MFGEGELHAPFLLTTSYEHRLTDYGFMSRGDMGIRRKPFSSTVILGVFELVREHQPTYNVKRNIVTELQLNRHGGS